MRYAGHPPPLNGRRGTALCIADLTDVRRSLSRSQGSPGPSNPGKTPPWFPYRTRVTPPPEANSPHTHCPRLRSRSVVVPQWLADCSDRHSGGWRLRKQPVIRGAVGRKTPNCCASATCPAPVKRRSTGRRHLGGGVEVTDSGGSLATFASPEHLRVRDRDIAFTNLSRCRFGTLCQH